MSNNYTQVILQFVFAVKYRQGLINESWENELFKYITGIIQNNNHKLLAINGIEDHIHILVAFHTTQSIADFMRDVKANSSKWINENQLTETKFEWQRGYGVFSYSKSALKNVVKYIENQKVHHKKSNFLEEYKEFLEKFDIKYEDEFIFKEPI